MTKGDIHLWNRNSSDTLWAACWEEYNGHTWDDNWTPGRDIDPLFKAGSRWLDVEVCQPHHVIIAGARQAVIGIICYLGMLSPCSIAILSSVSIHYCGRHCHRHQQHHSQQRTASASLELVAKIFLCHHNTTSSPRNWPKTLRYHLSTVWDQQFKIVLSRVVHQQLLKLLLIRLQYTIYTMRQRTRVIRVNDHSSRPMTRCDFRRRLKAAPPSARCAVFVHQLHNFLGGRGGDIYVQCT